jgi:hypothetical protein
MVAPVYSDSIQKDSEGIKITHPRITIGTTPYRFSTYAGFHSADGVCVIFGYHRAVSFVAEKPSPTDKIAHSSLSASFSGNSLREFYYGYPEVMDPSEEEEDELSQFRSVTCREHL